jgi:hypothetical protein
MDLWKKVLGMAIVGLCIGVNQVHAAPITIFNTGLDAVGLLAAGGTGDAHYNLTVSADPSVIPITPAIVASPIAAGLWVPNQTDSQWISPSANQACCPSGSGNPTGGYTYQTTFDLTGLVPSSALITGEWATDNNGVDILINGFSTVQTTGNADYGFFTPFSISSNFVPGMNTLDFVLNNAPSAVDGNPTGLHVRILTATADSVPEPAPLVLLGFGLAALGIVFKYQRS